MKWLKGVPETRITFFVHSIGWVVSMVLTNKQQLALANAPANQARALRRAFNEQNAGHVPGKTRDQKQKRRGVAARILSMPAGAGSRGVMPDPAHFNWHQTPASSNVIAPRGFGYYDAFAHDPYSVATHVSIGPATPIVGTTICAEDLVTRKPGSLDTGGEAGAILFLFVPGPSEQTAIAYWCSSTVGTDLCTDRVYVSPALAADKPHDAIVSRASLRIRNWTQSVGRGGVVRVLRMTTGIALTSANTNADLVDIQEAIRTHARTRTYGGDELMDTMQKNATVVDQSKAVRFRGWDIVEEPPGYPSTGAFASLTNTLWEPAYTPIAILFEPFVAAVSGGTVGNSYEITLRNQYLAHYKQGTMLANMAIDPKNDAQELEKHRAHEEANGSLLHKVGDALRHAGEWAWQHKGQIMGVANAAGRLGQKALPYVPRALPMMAV